MDDLLYIFTCQGHLPGELLVPSTTLAVTLVDFDTPHLDCKIGGDASGAIATKERQSSLHYGTCGDSYGDDEWLW